MSDDARNVDELPDWARNEIRELRRENGAHRTKNKEIEDARAALESSYAEKLDELQATVTLTDERAATAEATLAKTSLAVERGLPLNVVPMIVGDDEEARIASADALAALREPPATSGEPQQRQPDPAQEAEPAVDPRQQIADAFFGKQ